MPNELHKIIAWRVKTDFSVVQTGKLEHRENK